MKYPIKLSLCIGTICCSLLSAADRLPNIVILLADDLGYGELVNQAANSKFKFDWRFAPGEKSKLAQEFEGKPAKGHTVKGEEFSQIKDGVVELQMIVQGEISDEFSADFRGLGLKGRKFEQVDSVEAFHLQFNKDVIVESVAIVTGKGVCGGFYQMGKVAPLAIYCVDADNNAKTQGIISDLDVLQAGQSLKLSSSPHYGVEESGQWRLGAISVRILK